MTDDRKQSASQSVWKPRLVKPGIFQFRYSEPLLACPSPVSNGLLVPWMNRYMRDEESERKSERWKEESAQESPKCSRAVSSCWRASITPPPPSADAYATEIRDGPLSPPLDADV